MSERQPPYREVHAVRLRRVTVRVPEAYAEDLRRFDRELRARQSSEPAAASATQWRRFSPSAELLVDPECQARSVNRSSFLAIGFVGALQTAADASKRIAQMRLKRSNDHCHHRTYKLLELNFTSGKVTSPSVNKLESCSIFAPSIKPAMKRSLSISRL
jgi:hypothetical protein